MNRVSLILLAAMASTGCSTVEKRGYFTPDAEPQYRSGPKGSPCGMYHKGLPDAYVDKMDGAEISITANQYFYPYLWGPWLITVVPVFPVVWLSEFSWNKELGVQIRIRGKALTGIDDVHFTITPMGGDGKVLMPSSTRAELYNSNNATSTFIGLKFPVKYDTVNGFILHVRSKAEGVRDMDVNFVKASRWSWTQWSPNC